MIHTKYIHKNYEPFVDKQDPCWPFNDQEKFVCALQLQNTIQSLFQLLYIARSSTCSYAITWKLICSCACLFGHSSFFITQQALQPVIYKWWLIIYLTPRMQSDNKCWYHKPCIIVIQYCCQCLICVLVHSASGSRPFFD